MLSVAARVPTVAVRRPRPYVLVVDDHEPSRRQLQAVIELAGYACVSEACATSAVRRCDVRRPQLVVTDLSMPNLDGWGLGRWVRQRYPSVPLILVTGEDLRAAQLKAMRRTFSDVFLKPVDIEGLIGRVRRMMPAHGGPSAEAGRAQP